ncbi:intermembrane phospholipid transport protein YdbH family protein [Sphingorhabdus pulchriflava]|nr:YdbH domain-containing protein [Sphingorhabdus pulchriflava]
MEEELPEAPPARRWTKRRIFGAMFVLLVLLLAFAWWKRVDIADSYVRDYLEKNDVRATYEIEDIGFRAQRIRNVIVGDPANPDLTAKIVDIELSIGFGQPALREIRADGVRLKGRFSNGKLYLGELDKMRDMESKEPVSLPDLNVRLTDAVLSLVTPWGGLGVAAQGSGNLRNRFDGKLVARSRQMAGSGCLAQSIRYDGAVRIRNVRPEFIGPLAATSVKCDTQKLALDAPEVNGKFQFTESFDRWIGDVALKARSARSDKRRVDAILGKLSFNGSQQRTEYKLALSNAALRMPELAAQNLAADAEGSFSFSDTGIAVTARGDTKLSGVSLPQSILPSMEQLVRGTKSTPVGPVVARLDPALRRAIRSFDGTANFDVAIAPGGNKVAVDRLFVRSDSGVILRQQAPFAFADGRLGSPVALTMTGGDLPTGQVSLRQQGAGWAGTLNLQPYSAPGGTISIPTLAFEGGGRRPWRFNGQATITGPLLGGVVTGLNLPIDGLVSGSAFTMNATCTNVRYGGLTTGSLRLPAGTLRACPQRGSILSVANGETRFALTIPTLSIDGALGTSALKASGSRISFDLDNGFGADDIAIDLGRARMQSRFTIKRLDGKMEGPGVFGTMSGGAGQIGEVPLLISEAAGNWRWQGDVLGLDSSLFISDAEQVDRFNPLKVPDMQVTLTNNVISAIGNLLEPDTGIKVADVQILHNLDSSVGNALLSVDDLAFNDRLQPEKITPLTLGVIANVKGRLAGDGRIEWDGEAVRSTGHFTVRKTDLAAAFGPVEGLETELKFTDLLGMVTEPGQIARVKTVNPGVPALDGVIRYQLLPDQKVRIEEGRWPFFGGELILEPTILDFDEAAERNLTFRLIGLDAEKFLAGYDLQNLQVEGVFDGTLPMVFNQEGGRIVGGSLVSRTGGGQLSYLGELTYEDMGVFANFAFQALRSIRFTEMRMGVEGKLDGEIITDVSFEGLQQGSLAQQNFITKQLAKVPIKFNVRIEAEFLQLIGSIRGLYDADYALQQGKTLIDGQKDPVPGEGPPSGGKR